MNEFALFASKVRVYGDNRKSTMNIRLSGWRRFVSLLDKLLETEGPRAGRAAQQSPQHSKMDILFDCVSLTNWSGYGTGLERTRNRRTADA
jgi:hypothetical protein